MKSTSPYNISICDYCNKEDNCYKISCVRCDQISYICYECYNDIESSKYFPARKDRNEFNIKLNSIFCKSCRRSDKLSSLI